MTKAGALLQQRLCHRMDKSCSPIALLLPLARLPWLRHRRRSPRSPLAVLYSTNGTAFTTYYYILNLQGDVVKLIGTDGSIAASYTYDAWGNILLSSGTMAEKNPLRYRGYYYDSETGYYYLQSRYYDPATRRFLNADSLASTGQGFVGTNMFAYCNNNPVMGYDPSGCRPIWERWYENGLVAYTDTGTGCPYNSPSAYSVALRSQLQELMRGNYSEAVWNKLSNAEKMSLLQGFCTELSDILNAQNYTVRAVKLNDARILGATSAADSTIFINVKFIYDYNVLYTIAHEYYHAYQNNMIFGITAATEPAHYIKQWEYETMNYDNSGTSKYYNQYLEISAEWFAGSLRQELFDGFTGYGYYMYIS